MKYALCLSFLLQSCASRPINIELPEIQPTAIALMGKNGAAHACPVQGWILTSAHVAYMPYLSQSGFSQAPLLYLYETQEGQKGLATPYTDNHFVDLAILTLEPPISFYLKKGELPAPGDSVKWLEYDFRNVNNAFKSRVREAKVVSTVAGHILLDKEPTPGASGSCLINAAGEVVGVISFGHSTEDFNAFGGAVDLMTLPEAP